MNHDRRAYVGPSIVAEDTVLEGHAVIVSGGRIEAVAPRPEVRDDVPLTDLGLGFMPPGFVDIHVHGAAGHSYNEGTPATFAGHRPGSSGSRRHHGAADAGKRPHRVSGRRTRRTPKRTLVGHRRAMDARCPS